VVLATLGVLLAGAIAASLILRPGDGYPTTREGWAARWDTAMRAAGRTPGEGWDAWVALTEELRPVIDGTGVIDPDSERVQRVFDNLVAAGQITAPTPDGVGTEMVLESLVEVAQIRRALVRQVIHPELDRAIQEVDHDAFVLWMRRGWSVSRSCVSTPSVIGVLVQMAINGLLFEPLETWLFGHEGWRDPRAVDLLLEMPLVDLQAVALLDTEISLGLMAGAVRSASVLDSRDQMRRYEEFMQQWRTLLSSPDPSEQSRLESLARKYDSSSLFMWRRGELAASVPPVDSLNRIATASRVLRDGLLLRVAVERFNRETGNYPERLEDLIPDQLAAIPSDPFASDGQFRYRVLSGDASAAGPYLLYSVGVDGIDDGGRENPADAARGLGRPDVGGDHVFGPRRPKTAEDPDAEPVPDPAPQDEP
jgi:hypothetical protein